jgi:hypothetical protein
MRVRVHESRHHDATPGVDHLTVVVNQTLDFSPPVGDLDPIAANKERAVFYD